MKRVTRESREFARMIEAGRAQRTEEQTLQKRDSAGSVAGYELKSEKVEGSKS